MKLPAIAIFGVGLFASVAAQPANRTFEVASVKANPARVGIRGHAFPADRFEAANVPVRDLILLAYGTPGRLLPDSMQRGGPDWIDTDRFNVTAKVAPGDDHSVGHKQVLLRGLLAERFNLSVHVETVDSPIYALALAKSNGELGAQLHRSTDECGEGDAGSVPAPRQPGQPLRCVFYTGPDGSLFARGQTMSDFAYILTRTLGRMVRDETGLVGRFDADTQFNPDGLPGWQPLPVGAPNHDAPSLFEAMREQLGLKLDAARGQVDVLVIDHIERPAEN